MRERLNLWFCAVTTVLLVVMIGLALAPASAVVVPQNDPLRELEFRHPELWYENVFRPATTLPAATQRQLGSELSRLGVDPGHAFFDLRTGHWGTLILSTPLVPGTGVGNSLQWQDLGLAASPSGEALEAAVWDAFQSYLVEHAADLRIDPQELAEPNVSAIGDHLIQIHVGRTVDGIAVRGAFVTAAINSGNLVLLGERDWGQVDVSTTPGLTSADAEAVVRQHLAEFPFASLRERPRLELIPTSSQPEEAATFLGAGLEFRLAWVLTPDIEGNTGSWEALVDAHNGELLLFEDTNHYASRRVEGGIFPVSNDGEGDDGTLQFGYPMPFADITLDGTDVGFTTVGGNSPAGSDAGTMATILSGQFIRMNDVCGAVNESSAAGDLDLEGLPLPATDCEVSPGHSPGDTSSSRTGFYELNRLVEQARGYLDYPWLDLQLTANMNLNQVCNAFWDGSSVNFFKSGGGCRNTGEIAAVFDHEWGHGVDDNDANPSVSSPGESIADIIGQNRLNTSCIGRGFLIGQNCGGYGDPCLDCSGVRESDWAKRQSGLPHDIDWINANCGGIVGGTPCGGETHCEGTIVAEAAWDLVHRDLQGFEGSPWNLDPNTALEVGTRLSFLGSANVGNWYQCANDGTGGCNADGGYLGFLAADDDNGSLTDGTPHMSAIFAAFERHQLSCNAPAVVDSGCSGTPTAPTNVVTDTFDEGMQLTWDAVAGATEYWVFRTEGVHGCDFGKALIGKTTDTTFSEQGLRNGFEVFYSVSAVGAADSCVSVMSECASAIPTAGPSGFIEGTVTDADTGDPIAGATVEAVGPVTVGDETGPDGTYSILAPIGTYDVTADAEDYDPQTTPGVEVLEDVTVTVDFALSLTPRPIADVSPESFVFTLVNGEVGIDTLNIGNLGDLALEWSITTDVPGFSALGAPGSVESFDFEGPFDIDNWTLVNDPENTGGTFTTEPGPPVELFLNGGDAGTGGDTDFQIEIPTTGTITFSWGYQSTDTGDFDSGGYAINGLFTSLANNDSQVPFFDGTATVEVAEGDIFAFRVNTQDGLFGAGVFGVTNFEFVAQICDDVTDVPWLSAAPDSGTTAPGTTEEVTVTADSTAAGVGTHEAALCVATNDPDAAVVPVPVSLTVIGDGDNPVIDVDPDSLSSTLPPDGNETQALTISNLGGVDLDWQVTETGLVAAHGRQGVARAAQPQRARRSQNGSFDALRRTATGAGGSSAMDLAKLLGAPLPSLRVVNSQLGGVDCDGEPGIIIHDDGTYESAYTGNPDVDTEVRFVDLFTPSGYPATFNSVCVALVTLGQTTLDFDLVVFDDDGTDGAPGTELGSLSVTADGIPAPDGTINWFTYDISSLGIEVTEGSVFIGVRYAPPSPGGETVFIAADESTGNPPGFAGGYWWSTTNGAWVPTHDPDQGFENYRSLMLRAVEAPIGGGGDCELPTWVSVSPTSGTVPGGGNQVADVTFDATGLTPGDYTANLCLASNDPVTPLVTVPLTLTVSDEGGEPIADISPASFSFEVPAGGGDSDTLNVGNIGTADLVWSIDEAEGAPALLEEWSDNFDGYDTGSQLHGQGGWKGWANDPAAGALASDVQAQSTPNSVEILGASDLVHEYVDSSSGQWTYTAWQFIPSDFTGQSYFILLNTYTDDQSNLNWSTQVMFDGAGDQVSNDGVSGGTLPLIRGQWTEIRVEIDLDTDTQEFFYNGELLYSGTWTNENSGGGALNIGAVDLFANQASAVYYDDLSLSAGGEPPVGCAAPTDVPWLSATPASGTTPPADSSPVTVSVDAAALEPGDYAAQLCVNTNDPNAPLVEVPVSLTVIPPTGDPIADITPESFSFELAPGGSDSDTLNVGNIGTGDLIWSLEEAESLTQVSHLGDIVVFDDINFTVPVDITGGSVQWTTGDTCECDTAPFDFNIWTTGGNAAFFWPMIDGVQGGGVTLDGGATYAVLEPGATIGPDSEFLSVLSGDAAANWRQAEGVDAYLGFQFVNTDTGVTNFGYVHITTTGTTGHPATIVGWAYNAVGDPITIPGEGGGSCDTPSDIPWLSTDPTSGTTSPADSSPVNVAVDATTLDPGDYSAQLCVTTNDPNAPLVEVPVSLTVTEVSGPVADITPASFAFEVPQGGGDSDTLNVGNIGGEDLVWSIDEAGSELQSVLMPEGAPYRYGLAPTPAFNAPVGGDRASGITRGRGVAPADPVVLPAPQKAAIGALTEGFDDITQLPGAGWAMINNSDPEGPSSWFQGNESIFPAHEGAPNAYIAANYESTSGNGTISNWLITPEVQIVNGTEACFWTRKSDLFGEFLDRLEVRMSDEGESTDVGETADSVGDFTTLLLTIEPDLELPNEYPEEWTEFCVTVRERSRQPVTGRFAFRYWVTDSGPEGTNGDYIGIDTVSVTQPDDEPTPVGCDNPTDIPWLALDPTSGTTAPGASAPVTVSVDTAGLDVGDHAALLCVVTNDPAAPLVEVPVSLSVTESLAATSRSASVARAAGLTATRTR